MLQASWGRSGKQQQEQTSPNHVQRNFLCSVHRSSDNNVSSLRRLDVADPITTGVVRVCRGGNVQFDRVKRARRTQVSITQLHCIHIASFFWYLGPGLATRTHASRLPSGGNTGNYIGIIRLSASPTCRLLHSGPKLRPLICFIKYDSTETSNKFL